ncbi:MAG TPA: hypothetical protein VFW65_11085 [Pseudonocardiaceae bacterium]|nr:hypothetical protein [Pseudonocardiaceae bacterium]
MSESGQSGRGKRGPRGPWRDDNGRGNDKPARDNNSGDRRYRGRDEKPTRDNPSRGNSGRGGASRDSAGRDNAGRDSRGWTGNSPRRSTNRDGWTPRDRSTQGGDRPRYNDDRRPRRDNEGGARRDDRAPRDHADRPRRDSNWSGSPRDDNRRSGGWTPRDDRRQGRDNWTPRDRPTQGDRPRRDTNWTPRDDRRPARDQGAPRDTGGRSSNWTSRSDDRRPAGSRESNWAPRKDDRRTGSRDWTPRGDDRRTSNRDSTPRSDDRRIGGRDSNWTPRTDDRRPTSGTPRDDRRSGGGWAPRDDRRHGRDNWTARDRPTQGDRPRRDNSWTPRDDRRDASKPPREENRRSGSWSQRDRAGNEGQHRTTDRNAGWSNKGRPNRSSEKYPRVRQAGSNPRQDNRGTAPRRYEDKRDRRPTPPPVEPTPIEPELTVGQPVGGEQVHAEPAALQETERHDAPPAVEPERGPTGELPGAEPRDAEPAHEAKPIEGDLTNESEPGLADPHESEPHATVPAAEPALDQANPVEPDAEPTEAEPTEAQLADSQPEPSKPEPAQPADETRPVEEAQQANERPPVEEAQQANERPPVEEAQPANERPPVEEAQPANEGRPVEEARPPHETAPPQPTDSATEPNDPSGRPELPEEAALSLLDREIRGELRGLPKNLAEIVGRHLAAAGLLIDDDPELALQHARFARARATRVAVVREAVGLTAYQAGEWAEALSELRAARRMSNGPGHIAVMADCERALGRPERALELAREGQSANLPPDEAIELKIVAAGARRDMGQLDAAVVMLQIPELDPNAGQPWTARLCYAYADNLAAVGRTEEAIRWFLNAAQADDDGDTDAAERAIELSHPEGIQPLLDDLS